MELPNGIPCTQELLDAQAHVWNHIFNFINSMSLKCAIQLGIPDIIHKHDKPMTLSELIDALPINKAKSLCVERLMRILIHSKFFTKVKISEEDKEEGYWLTPNSLLLPRDEPMNMTSFVLAMLDPILTDPFHHVSEWFKTDDPTPFLTIHGRTFWEQAGQDPRLNHFFNESMASDARLVTSVIVKDYRQVFQGLKSMVDVGGGTGTVAKAIADAFPSLNCTVLELPHVVAGLEGTKNVTFVAGDMFESIPPVPYPTKFKAELELSSVFQYTPGGTWGNHSLLLHSVDQAERFRCATVFVLVRILCFLREVLDAASMASPISAAAMATTPESTAVSCVLP